MTVQMRAAPRGRLAGRAVVVTGASAGVGRATALAAAREGARVGLVARSAAELEALAAAIRADGGEAIALPADVADPAAVEGAAERMQHTFGRIDIWINAAMATVFAPVDRLAAEDVRRVSEVTYLGSVNGILAAYPRMRSQGRGVIVQVGSALAFRGIPLQAPYCAAKHAIRGFVSSLRAELIHERSPLKITEVHLPAVNTPQFAWSRTRIARQPRPVGKVYTADAAAEAILKAALQPRRDYWLGGSTAQAVLAQALAPALMDRLMARQAWEGQFAGPAPQRDGNLFEPVEGLHGVDGPFASEAQHRAIMVHGPEARLALACVGVGAGVLLGAGLSALLRGRAGEAR